MLDTKKLTRNHLETLSSSDLISLAEEYGIDIPDDLNRRFIIAELLDVIEDLLEDESDIEIVEDEEGCLLKKEPLPLSYNESIITALLKNPAWLFVFWDIKESELESCIKEKGFITFSIRVCFFKSEDDEKPGEYHDIPIKYTDRAQYVFIPHDEYAVRVDLISEFKNANSSVLARSKKIIIPKCDLESQSLSVNTKDSPILELSGLPELRRLQYINHRQSFT